MKKAYVIAAVFAVLILVGVFLWRQGYFSIKADTLVNAPAAIQTIYQNGVPHTDKDGNTRSTYDQNKSFFPIGIYFPNSDADLNTVSNPSTNFNLAFLYNTYAAHNNDAVNSVINKIKSSSNPDFKIILSNKNTDYFDLNWVKLGQFSSPDNSKILPSFPLLEQNNDKKNIFAWYLADEPIKYGNPWVSFLETLSAKIKARGVTKPLFEVNTADMTNTAWNSFAKLGDIAVLDNYPTDQKWVRNDPNLMISSLDRSDIKVTIPKTVSATVAANNSAKPVWLVVQAMKPKNGADGKQTRFPTPVEERAMVYAGIVNGATGIIYYAYDTPEVLRANAGKEHIGINPSPDPNLSQANQAASKTLWNSIAGTAGINSELKRLSPAILSSTSKSEYSVNTTQDTATNQSPTPVRTILKEYNGKYYLIAVNVNNNKAQATFSFVDNVFKNSNIVVQFENRNLSESNQSFADSFEPFAVHVYSWDAKNRSCLLTGFNVISSASVVSPSSILANNNVIFDFNQIGDESWRKSTNQDIAIIKPDTGYYVYSFGNNCYALPENVSASSSDTAVIRRGWNLLANPTDAPANLTAMKYLTLKKGRSNSCTGSTCFEEKRLSDLLTGSDATSRSYKYLFLIQNGNTTDPNKAFQKIQVTSANIGTVQIPAHTTFWFYLFE